MSSSSKCLKLGPAKGRASGQSAEPGLLTRNGDMAVRFSLVDGVHDFFWATNKPLSTALGGDKLSVRVWSFTSWINLATGLQENLLAKQTC